MEFQNAHILSAQQLNTEDIEKILRIAVELEPIAQKKLTSDLLRNKVLAALFYEPSTRTRLSFETAMNRLGGRVISVVGMDNSSLKKGETLSDTARVISSYADVIAMRHPDAGSLTEFSRGASVPLLNAGDGVNEHPTQALTDIFTIEKEQGRINGLTIAMVGDLKYGRTVHSLSYLLSRFSVKLIFVSPPELKMPDTVTAHLREKGVYFDETQNLEEAIRKSDVLYMTRIQKERFATEAEYRRHHGVYVLTKGLIERCNQHILILHPLPRYGEISSEIDELAGAAYFRQVENAVAVRMALLYLLLGDGDND
ncbi:aspartate carbamoyltransferase [Candidatus Peregrinibacteria bacterium]|nr:aspartate carbamoyltransferase [Candidatus Peregrinibacteria bacterium]